MNLGELINFLKQYDVCFVAKIGLKNSRFHDNYNQISFDLSKNVTISEMLKETDVTGFYGDEDNGYVEVDHTISVYVNECLWDCILEEYLLTKENLKNMFETGTNPYLECTYGSKLIDSE